MGIDLYQIPISSPCRAVLMTVKQIGIDVNLKLVNLFEGEQYDEEFLKINPLHSVPTIDDNGFYLWESRAIMTYLANKYAPDSDLYPKDARKRAEIDQLLYFDIGTLYKTMGATVYGPVMRGEDIDPQKAEDFKNSLSVLEGFLKDNAYVAGDCLTLADLTILSTLTFAQLIDYDYSQFSGIQSWLDKLKEELPYYKEINEDPINEYKEKKSKK